MLFALNGVCSHPWLELGTWKYCIYSYKPRAYHARSSKGDIKWTSKNNCGLVELGELHQKKFSIVGLVYQTKLVDLDVIYYN